MLEIRSLTASDEAEWRRLWHAYLLFYETQKPEDVYASTWARLVSADHPNQCGLLACKDGVSTVCTSLAFLPIVRALLNFLSIHLSADGTPYSIAANQNIRIDRRSILEFNSNAFTLPLRDISIDWVPILDKVGFDLPALIYQYFL